MSLTWLSNAFQRVLRLVSSGSEQPEKGSVDTSERLHFRHKRECSNVSDDATACNTDDSEEVELLSEVFFDCLRGAESVFYIAPAVEQTESNTTDAEMAQQTNLEPGRHSIQKSTSEPDALTNVATATNEFECALSRAAETSATADADAAASSRPQRVREQLDLSSAPPSDLTTPGHACRRLSIRTLMASASESVVERLIRGCDAADDEDSRAGAALPEQSRSADGVVRRASGAADDLYGNQPGVRRWPCDAVPGLVAQELRSIAGDDVGGDNGVGAAPPLWATEYTRKTDELGGDSVAAVVRSPSGEAAAGTHCENSGKDSIFAGSAPATGDSAEAAGVLSPQKRSPSKHAPSLQFETAVALLTETSRFQTSPNADM